MPIITHQAGAMQCAFTRRESYSVKNYTPPTVSLNGGPYSTQVMIQQTGGRTLSPSGQNDLFNLLLTTGFTYINGGGIGDGFTYYVTLAQNSVFNFVSQIRQGGSGLVRPPTTDASSSVQIVTPAVPFIGITQWTKYFGTYDFQLNWSVSFVPANAVIQVIYIAEYIFIENEQQWLLTFSYDSGGQSINLRSLSVGGGIFRNNGPTQVEAFATVQLRLGSPGFETFQGDAVTGYFTG